jgi:chromosome segregation ATPase
MVHYLIAAIVALVIGVAIQTHRLDSVQTGHAEYVAGIERQAKEASEQARKTEQAHQKAIDQVRADAQAQKAADNAAAAQLAADGKLLRDTTTKLLADRAYLNSRLAARGKTISDLTDLLAQLRQQLDDFAQAAAVGLDEYRRAGFACEASYDAMSAKRH